MALLITGLAIFLGIHAIPSLPATRNGLRTLLGEGGYKAVFALFAFLGLGLIIWGKGLAPYQHVWGPPPWSRHATMTLMLLSCFCFAAVYLPSNLKRLTAHPMLWGTTLWAGAHLFANGDLASLCLFGAFLGFSALDMWSANRRGAQPQGKPVSAGKEVLTGLVSVGLYAALLLAHPYAFGVAVLRG